jgi:AbrB family looped-hinge helix DNA binding protein
MTAPYPYSWQEVRNVEATAKITAKGQITVPKAVRDALGVREGDTLVFRVEGDRAVVAATPDLLDLAGVVSVPVGARGIDWDEVRRRAWRARGGAVTG